MPLPKSAIPAYQPRSFISGESRREFDKQMELFYRYHPAAFQMKTFELLLKDETYKAKEASEKEARIAKELERLDGLIARFRETGAGPSGSAGLAGRYGGGTRTGTRTGGRGGGMRSGYSNDFISDMTRNEIARQKIESEAGQAALEEFDRQTEIPRYYAQFAAEFLGNQERLRKIGRMAPTDLDLELGKTFLDRIGQLAISGEKATPLQRKKAATDFYYKLRNARPDLLTPPQAGGTLSSDHMRVLQTIDALYETGGAITRSMMSGIEPMLTQQKEERRVQEALRVPGGPGVFESKAQELLDSMPMDQKDTDKDGVVSPAENAAAMQKAMEQARAELGIATPLSDEEQVALQRYLSALRNDGRATEDEFGSPEEMAEAKAAYDRARQVENIPRGAAPYFDDVFLDLLQRREELRGERPTQRPGTPVSEAARRTLGLPQVTTEAYAAAAAVSPLAAQALPYSLKRYQDAAGAVHPNTAVERKAQRLIDASPNKHPEFNDFMQQVERLFPNDPMKRQEAAAYYGAHFYALQERGSTFSEAALRGDPKAQRHEGMPELEKFIEGPKPAGGEGVPTPTEPPPLPESAVSTDTLKQTERGTGVEEEEVERLLVRRAAERAADVGATPATPASVPQTPVSMGYPDRQGYGNEGVSTPSLPPLPTQSLWDTIPPPTPVMDQLRAAPSMTAGAVTASDPALRASMINPATPSSPRYYPDLYPGDPSGTGARYPGDMPLVFPDTMQRYSAYVPSPREQFLTDPNVTTRFDARVDMNTGETYYVDPATGAEYTVMPNGSMAPRQ